MGYIMNIKTVEDRMKRFSIKDLEMYVRCSKTLLGMGQCKQSKVDYWEGRLTEQKEHNLQNRKGA
jgi:hypothetical protein